MHSRPWQDSGRKSGRDRTGAYRLPLLIALAPAALLKCVDNGGASSKRKRLFRMASGTESCDDLEAVIPRSEVNARHRLGWTALHVASVNGNAKAVGKLLRAGADANASDHFSTAREAAKAVGMHAVEAQMVREDEFSAILNPGVSFRGFTPLHYAALANDLATARALLDNGADPLIENDRGHTAIDYARDGGVKQLLQQRSEEFRQKRLETEAEARRQFPLEERLKKFIVGQEYALATVAAAIRRRENGWCDEQHPLVFLFLGSSGIGKTELAKQVARYLHSDSKKTTGFIRVDMSEYQVRCHVV